jgi:hypothetical protein
MEMKQILKNAIIAGSAMISSCAAANEVIDLVPYLGAEYYQAWMQPRPFYKPFLPEAYPGASFYLGTKVHPNFGFEFGYDWSVQKTKNWVFNASSRTSFSGKTKIRRSGVHFDIAAFLPACECLELMATLGYGWVQSKIEIRNMSITPNAAVPNSSAMATLSSKGRGVIRAGIGANYMVTAVLGVRTKLGWENTATLKIDGNGYFKQLGYPTRGFKGTTTLTVGAFYKF